MKLLTLNTHSLQEENYEQKLEWFLEGILEEKPDIITLQEVSQTAAAELAEDTFWEGQYLIPSKVPLKEDNHAAQVAYRLQREGVDCSWVWLPVKLGYEKYDEGIAILSIGRKITAADLCLLTESDDYRNWRRRMALGIQVEGRADWFYSVHMGWWDDTEEPFRGQWEKLKQHLSEKRKKGRVWLMGDFNASDSVSGQSYACILKDGWMDTYLAAGKREGESTASSGIDGWRERTGEKEKTGLRLDYIFCSQHTEIKSCRVMFDGENRPEVSDHSGVLTETAEI